MRDWYRPLQSEPSLSPPDEIEVDCSECEYLEECQPKRTCQKEDEAEWNRLNREPN